jgi:hypothetical protein
MESWKISIIEGEALALLVAIKEVEMMSLDNIIF